MTDFDSSDFDQQHQADRVVFTHRTGARLEYHSMNYHRVQSQDNSKSIWIVDLDMEHLLFRKSEHADWRCDDGYMWSVGNDPNGRDELGTKGERIARFAPPSQGSTAWHGYPFRCSKSSPPASFIRSWHQRGIITRSFRNRLVKEYL